MTICLLPVSGHTSDTDYTFIKKEVLSSVLKGEPEIFDKKQLSKFLLGNDKPEIEKIFKKNFADSLNKISSLTPSDTEFDFLQNKLTDLINGELEKIGERFVELREEKKIEPTLARKIWERMSLLDDVISYDYLGWMNEQEYEKYKEKQNREMQSYVETSKEKMGEVKRNYLLKQNILHLCFSLIIGYIFNIAFRFFKNISPAFYINKIYLKYQIILTVIYMISINYYYIKGLWF